MEQGTVPTWWKPSPVRNPAASTGWWSDWRPASLTTRRSADRGRRSRRFSASAATVRTAAAALYLNMVLTERVGPALAEAPVVQYQTVGSRREPAGIFMTKYAEDVVVLYRLSGGFSSQTTLHQDKETVSMEGGGRPDGRAALRSQECVDCLCSLVVASKPSRDAATWLEVILTNEEQSAPWLVCKWYQFGTGGGPSLLLPVPPPWLIPPMCL